MLPTILGFPRRASARGAKPKHATSTGSPSKNRQRRLRLERLESREVLSAVATPSVAEPLSEVMQASLMSAFFQQSALYSSGQPTGDPTVTWRAARDERPLETAAPLVPAAETLGEEDACVRDSRPTELLPAGSGSGVGAGRSAISRPLRLQRAWPAHVFAPYVDMGVWPTFDLIHAAETQGIKYFTLAFVAADAHDRPSWSGHDEYRLGSEFDLALRRQVSELRSVGGDVTVSFGGPRQLELAQVITDVDALQKAYRNVIDAYALRRIDFVLEGSGLDDVASAERRSQAIARLQRDIAAEGRKLDVWLTLPAEPGGLTEGGVQAVRSAVQNDIELGGVNIKTGNYSSFSSPNPRGRMGVYSIEAAINVFYQLHNSLAGQETPAQTWHKIGITPMIGRSDAAGEDFSPRDAQAVYDFARQQGMGMIGVWSLNRDQYDSTADATGDLSSGVEQQAFEFSDIFKPFTRSE